MAGSDINSESRPLAQRLASYGCTSVIRLDEKPSNPAQQDYFDLLPKPSNPNPMLTAVAEHQGMALLYLIDASWNTTNDLALIAEVSRKLANRSDPAWLGVLRPGSLEVFPIGFHETAEIKSVKVIDERSDEAPLFYQSLVHGTFEKNHLLKGTDYVFNKIFELLTRTTNEFVPKEGNGPLDALEVLSMAGRALFFRFLIDRRIVQEDEREAICPDARSLKDAFSTAKTAAQTSAWLDATFNGDFLPLIDDEIPADNREDRAAAYHRFFLKIEGSAGSRIFKHLEAILRGWRTLSDDSQLELKLDLDWNDLDFAHIPVGVLSQVYESFSHRADPHTARDTSVHYTPRNIAALMVDEAFAATKEKAGAKVLDSSCGAGIFLVLAFRRLVRENWKGGVPPKTAVIRNILYNQLRGFDISESALRLAALALYITAIELDGSPRPPQVLKFPRNLRGAVLHLFGDEEVKGNKAHPLGSLGPEVSMDFDKAFDIVIGNPPWTPQTNKLNKKFTEIGRRVLTARGLTDLSRSYCNPDNNPDLPFLWRAMEWAKDGGIIALAMPARLFGRTSGNGFEAWRAVMRSVQVTGLINGADLRWSSAVWKIKVPFCIFFARNSKPALDYRFYYSAPINEPELNKRGRFRIDYESAKSLSIARVERQPWILKTLALGTWLDVELVNSIIIAFPKSLDAVWTDWNPDGDKTSVGYNRSPGRKQALATFFGELKDFNQPTLNFTIEPEKLKTYFQQYGSMSAHRPRTEALYQPPLVIVHQSPGDNPKKPHAFISIEGITFSQSFFGYSCAEHPEAETLAALIYLLPHSTLFAYFCLMTSRRSGFDRQTFNKEEFDALPFPDLATLPASIKTNIRNLADRLQHDDKKPWKEINDFIFQLYGLDADAVQIAEDTLFAAAAYRKAGKAALERTTQSTRADFMKALRDELEPYFDVCGEHVAVQEAKLRSNSQRVPWFFLAVSRENGSVTINASLMEKAMEAANQNGCSRIIVHAPSKQGLLIGLLSQRRWWTVTRARLCAQHIIRNHLSAFGLPGY